MTKFYKWLDNYWYHYKWQTLIAAFFLFAVIFLVVSTMNIREADCVITYGGPYVPTVDERSEICAALAGLIGDINGDGERLCEVADSMIMTDSQLTEEYEDGDEIAFNKNIVSENRKKFAANYFSSESVICFCDPGVYAMLRDEGNVLLPLEEAFGIRPEEAQDEYSIALRDTAVFSALGSMKYFPEDTVVCARRMNEMRAGNKNSEKEYGVQLGLLEKLVFGFS